MFWVLAGGGWSLVKFCLCKQFKCLHINVNILNVYINKTNSLLFDFLENLCSEFWQVGGFGPSLSFVDENITLTKLIVCLLFEFLGNLCSEFWQVELLVPRRVADIFQFPFSHNTNYIPLLLDIYIFLNLDPDFLLEKALNLKLCSIKDWKLTKRIFQFPFLHNTNSIPLLLHIFSIFFNQRKFHKIKRYCIVLMFPVL